MERIKLSTSVLIVRDILSSIKYATIAVFTVIGFVTVLTVATVAYNFTVDEIKDTVAVMLIRSGSTIFAKQDEIIKLQNERLRLNEQQLILKDQQLQKATQRASKLEVEIREAEEPVLYKAGEAVKQVFVNAWEFWVK